jgi:hypothetical protein
MSVPPVPSDAIGGHLQPSLPNFYGETAPQTTSPPQYDGLLYKTGTGDYTYRYLRECSQHYVVKLSLDYLCGKLAGVPWTVRPTYQALQANEEATYAKTLAFLEAVMGQLRLDLLYRGLREMLIYGWSPFEIIWGYDGGLFTVRELKPLLHDYTEIYIDRNGNFDGLRQIFPHTKNYVELPKENSLVLSHDPIGQNWYGTSALQSVLPLYDQWKVLNNEVQKFFSKVVGSRHLLKFPVGQSKVGIDHNGVPIYKDNWEIAKDVLSEAERNASIALPQAPTRVVDAVSSAENGWDFQVLSDTPGNTPYFQQRMKEIEAAMVNACGYPSMVILESLSMGGNRALIEGYTQVAQTVMESRNHYLAREVSRKLLSLIVQKNAGAGFKDFFEIVPGNIDAANLTMENHPSLQQGQEQ